MQSLVKRVELVNKLASVLEKPLAVLVAPGGSGKTMLVKQYIDEHLVNGTRVVWLKVPQTVQSPVTLIEAFLLAWSAFVPLEYFRQYANQSLGYFLQLFGAFLEKNVLEPIFFVLDDAHYLNGSQWESFFMQLALVFPASVKVLIVARELPPIDYVSHTSGSKIGILMESLNFSETEVYELGREQHGVDVSIPYLQGLWQQFHGWPLGTALVLNGGLELGKKLSSEAFSQLGLVILDELEPHEREFLLSLAVLDLMDLRLLREVLGEDYPEHLFFALFGKGFFAKESETGFRMHDIFLQYCRERLREEYPDRERTLRGRLARYYFKEGMLEASFEEYMRAGLLKELVGLAEINPSLLMSSMNVVLLKDFVQALMVDLSYLEYLVTKKFGFILYVRKVLQQVGLADEMIRFCLACLEFKGRGLSVYGEASLKYDLAFSSFSRGDIAEAKRLCNEVVAADVEFFEEDLVDEWDRVFPFRYKVQMIEGMMNHEFSVMSDLYKEVLESIRPGIWEQPFFNIAPAMSNSLVFSRLNNEVILPDDYRIGYLVELMKHYQGSQLGVILVVNFASLLRDLGDVDGAADVLVPYLNMDLSDSHKVALYDAYAGALVDKGWFEEAYVYLKRCFILKGVKGQGTVSGEFVLGLICCTYYLGMKDEFAFYSDLLLKEMKEREDWDGFYNLRVRLLSYELEDWNVSIVEKKFLSLLEEVKAANEELREHYLIRVLFAFYQGSRHLHERLAEMIMSENANPGGLHWYAIELGVRGLLEKLDFSAYPVMVEIVAKVTKALADRSLRVGNLVKGHDLVEVNLIGAEVVRLNEGYLDMRAWTSSQNRYVFYYLLFKGSTESGALATVFWPDKSAEAAGALLRKSIGWIREFLGKDSIVSENGYYFLNSDLKIRCDVLQLRDLLGMRGLDLVGMDNRSALSLDLVERYVLGFVLEQADYAWLSDLRVSIEHWQQELLERYVLLMRKRKLTSEVVLLLNRFRRQQPFVEDIWRLLMDCLAELGEGAQLVLLYREMCDFYQKELGILPSKQSRDLYGRLMLSLDEVAS